MIFLFCQLDSSENLSPFNELGKPSKSNSKIVVIFMVTVHAKFFRNFLIHHNLLYRKQNIIVTVATLN
jgi:hypothetical protein